MKKAKLLMVTFLVIFGLLLSSNAFAVPVKWQMVDWNAWGRLYDDGSLGNPVGTPLNSNPYLPGVNNPTQTLSPGYHAPDGTEDAFGVAQVFKISTDDAAGTTLWQLGSEEITVFFWGADDVRLDVAGPGDTTLWTLGFKVEVWLDTSPDYTPQQGPAGRSNLADPSFYNTATNDGTLLLSAVAHNLVEPNGDLYDIKETGNSVTGAFFGSGFLDITGGSWAQYYNTDFYSPGASATGGTADMTISFSTQGNGQNNWVITGTGEAFDGNVVPEPTTIALLGFGLLGAAFVGRKRSFKK